MSKDLTNDVAKGQRYKDWYERDGLKEALENIKQAYINGLINSHVTDVQGRENCYIAVNLVEKIESHIINVIGGGKLADKTLQRIQKEQNKKVINLF